MLSQLTAYFQAYKSDTSGATVVEYTLIMAGVALIISAGLIAYGNSMQEMLETGFADAFGQ